VRNFACIVIAGCTLACGAGSSVAPTPPPPPLDSSATLTFNGLRDSGVPFTPYTESGFTVSPRTGAWLVGAAPLFTPPVAYIYFNAREVPLDADVTITRQGSPFGLTSLQIYSSITSIPYTIIGLKNSSTVLSLSATQPNTRGNFVAISNPQPKAVLDALIIRLTNPGGAGVQSLTDVNSTNPVGLDNVALSY
jgi:hypothetical protein